MPPRKSIRSSPAGARFASMTSPAPVAICSSRIYPATATALDIAIVFLHDAVLSRVSDPAMRAPATMDRRPAQSFQVVVRVFAGTADDAGGVVAAQVASLSDGAPGALANTFAEWLRECLRARGLSQHAAARELGVSPRTMSRWVCGQTEPRLRDARRINDVFGPARR